ncbi:MAG: hypothetical protein QS748_04810 [Candidatus Endonucleobacter bathymodioli]|uniref:Uncharacterized protein n=1 Tax=Candidatus Endonucleibacter bathymodioli TaxID=539814 RepID=A0AA90NSK5_9GAMM|nr:hypothetical protein [Candidatus Endonucleobacter bathymodioli]
MSRKHNLGCCSIFADSKYVKNVILLLLLACVGRVYAEQVYASPDVQHCQKDTKDYQKDTIKNWFYEKCDSAINFAGSYFNSSNVAEGSGYGRSNDNSIRYLQHMCDENDLYGKLEEFKEKPVFEVLAIVYVSILLEVDNLDQDIIKTGLVSPDWLISFSDITQEIKKRVGIFLSESTKTKFELLTKEGKMAVEEEFQARGKQCSSKLQTLLQCQVNTYKANSLINAKLNEQVNLLISKARNNTNFSPKQALDESLKMREILLTPYLVPAISNESSVPQFPVLEALVNWSMHNADSNISKLLDDSKRWCEQNSIIAKENQENEIRKNDQIFFCYLNNNSKTEWYEGNKYYSGLKTRELTAELLDSAIIKNVIHEFTTVEQLVAACKEGEDGLNTMHNKREEQERLSPEKRAQNKKEQKKGEFSQADMDEYLQQGVAANIKDSLFGKMASGIFYVFNAIKSNFVTTPTKQEKSRKVVVDWIKFVQKNALNVKGCAQHKSIKLVMSELTALDKERCGNLTIVDALTALVKQRFDTRTKGEAFTLLTGLECESNEKQETCYSDSVTPCNEPTNTDNNTNVYKNKKYGVGISESDNVLHEPDFEQQSCNADTSADQCDDPYLHQDWCCIKVEDDEKSDDDSCSKDRMCYFGSGNGLGSMVGKFVAIALPIFIIANAIPSSYSAPVPSAMSIYNVSDIIDITSAEDLSMIGNTPMYPSSGNYQFMNSFDASNFTKPIGHFSGNINGNNNTIYNLPVCLMYTLEDAGTVQNLTISNANIASQECYSVVAKVMKDNALVRLVDIKSGYFYVQDVSNAINSKAIYIGTVAEKMAGSSRIEQITIIDSKIDCYLSANVKYGTYFTVGGVVGVMVGDAELRDIVVMNTSVYSGGEKVDYAVRIGGAVGYMEGAATIGNVVFIDTHVRADQMITYLGGTVGYLATYDGSICNIVSISTDITSRHSSVQRIAWVAGVVGLGAVEMHHNLVINGTIKVGAASSDAIGIGAAIGGWFSFAGASSVLLKATDNIIINSKIEVIGIPYRSNSIGICTGSSDYIINKNCLMAKNIDFSVSHNGNNMLYSYKKVSNLTGQCLLVRLSFIDGECNVDNDEFSVFQKSIKTINLFKAFTDAARIYPVEGSTTKIIIAVSGSAATIVGAIIAGGYCYSKRYNCSLSCCSSVITEVDNIDELIGKMPLTSMKNEADAKERDQMLVP